MFEVGAGIGLGLGWFGWVELDRIGFGWWGWLYTLSPTVMVLEEVFGGVVRGMVAMRFGLGFWFGFDWHALLLVELVRVRLVRYGFIRFGSAGLS